MARFIQMCDMTQDACLFFVKKVNECLVSFMSRTKRRVSDVLEITLISRTKRRVFFLTKKRHTADECLLSQERTGEDERTRDERTREKTSVFYLKNVHERLLSQDSKDVAY